ncbi:MAG TPA: ergothioneine biosynthesis protein EgtB [Planctomycetaceae bacterium]|nr:ergothioneine biosynthesis protein EgtB [Planctomycetaceae bacterium]
MNSASEQTQPAVASASLLSKFLRIRAHSEQIAAPLSAEDCCIQSMPDVSPIRWHLAHTTWFFETFLLKPLGNYRSYDDSFEYLFNSYYNSVGQQFPRHRRGLISRPGLEETLNYRRHVDSQLVERLKEGVSLQTAETIRLGLQHEQQHQELMLTDIKHVLSCNPLLPAYSPDDHIPKSTEPAESIDDTAHWLELDERIVETGHAGELFCFDNELPRHRNLIHKHRIGRRLVTNGEFQQFVDDDGYERPKFWLSMGWDAVQAGGWKGPLYWKDNDEFRMDGLVERDPYAPVTHISYFEADAFSRWAGCRLPTEFEWEHSAANHCKVEGEAIQNGVFADRSFDRGDGIGPHNNPHRNRPNSELLDRTGQDWLGNVWEWTCSQYTAYPGFTAAEGALGEYNGKFMCNQFVLRGGSCATSSDHIRTSYRNFFPPDARWQFSGIRLAKD